MSSMTFVEDGASHQSYPWRMPHCQGVGDSALVKNNAADSCVCYTLVDSY
jgi:hypothetical protein